MDRKWIGLLTRDRIEVDWKKKEENKLWYRTKRGRDAINVAGKGGKSTTRCTSAKEPAGPQERLRREQEEKLRSKTPSRQGRYNTA